MSEQQKKRLAIIVAFIVLIILFGIFWARFRKVPSDATVAAVLPDTDSGAATPTVTVPNIYVDLPPLIYNGGDDGGINYVGGNIAAPGCALCASIGYAMLAPAGQPASPAAPPMIVLQQYATRAIAFGGGGSAPSTIHSDANTRLF